MYEVLVEFSYESPQSAHLLVDYLNRRLQRHSAHGVLKTLKCVRQLVERGSRHFRLKLRANDEHIKRAPDFGSQRDAFTGTAVLAETRRLAAEILSALFDPAVTTADSSSEPEVAPQLSSSRLSGMGGGGSSSAGQGFGSSSVARPAGFTEKVR
jgi:hypothetical protein